MFYHVAILPAITITSSAIATPFLGACGLSVVQVIERPTTISAGKTHFLDVYSHTVAMRPRMYCTRLPRAVVSGSLSFHASRAICAYNILCRALKHFSKAKWL